MSGGTGPNDLPQDARLERAWRAASTETPATSLDATILAAARAEAARSEASGSRTTRPAWWSRWTPLAAAASVGALAFLLVQWLPRADLGRPDDAHPEGAPRSAIAPPARPAPVLREQPTSPPDPATEMPGAKAVLDHAAPGISAQATSPQARSPAAAAAAGEPSLDPGAWARRIGELHASGDREAAVFELRRFRQTYPDADTYLSEDIRTWAAATDSGSDVPPPER